MTQSRRLRACGVALAALLLFGAGAAASHAGWLGAAKSLLMSTWSEIRGSIDQTPAIPAPRLILDIKQKHIERLIEKRTEALDRGILLTSSDDFVPARLGNAKKAVKVSLRLKGDWVDHLAGEKWSFRIKVKGDKTLFGMKQFSLQHPGTRAYLYEWLFHEALRHEDLVALRYRFVRVTLNGKDLGLYALEEHFEKRLLEHNRRREGPILRFNEDLLWAERAHGVSSETEDYYRSKVDAFKLRKTLASESQRPLFEKGVTLLRGFRSGSLGAESVFDVRRMGIFFALVDLLGAAHATAFHNIRFYYNPITSRLEPIGFDAEAGGGLRSASIGGLLSSLPFRNQLASDSAFNGAYHRALVRVCSDGYLENFIAGIRPQLERYRALLDTEFEFLFSEDVFHGNRATLRALLTPFETLRAHFVGRGDGRVRFAITSLSPFAYEITSAGTAGALAPLAAIETIPPILPGRPLPRTSIEVPAPEGEPAGWVLGVRLAGTTRERLVPVLPWSGTNPAGSEPTVPHRLPNCSKFSFVSVDETKRRIYVATGTWKVEEPIVFPAGYTVICRAGTQLVLSPGAHLLSYSPLEWTGEEGSPVVISSHGTAPAGVAVMEANGRSVLHHVEFRGLGSPTDRDWSLPASVTFYESPVSMRSCRLRDVVAEDALNVVRCDFALHDVLFQRCSSDALDADFADGLVEDTTFLEIGNDAVDVSGSKITLRRVRVSGAGDKGVSAGERSHIEAQSVTVVGSEIGFAAKDRSDIHINGATLERCRLAFAVYQKKPEYGPGAIRARHITLRNVDRTHLVERGSSLYLNGKDVAGTMDSIEAMLYGNDYGKSSR